MPGDDAPSDHGVRDRGVVPQHAVEPAGGLAVPAAADRLPLAGGAWIETRGPWREIGDRIVFVAFSKDETLMGFGFPKGERQMLVDSEPDKFLLPRQSDMRYNWVVARLDALDHEEMTELVTDAWAMCVPKKVFNAYFSDTP